MPQVRFTSHLSMHIDCPDMTTEGETLREVLEDVFQQQPALRSYLLDDQQRLRQHVVIFIDDQVIQDRVKLSDTIHSQSEVYVMQALSGG